MDAYLDIDLDLADAALDMAAQIAMQSEDGAAAISDTVLAFLSNGGEDSIDDAMSFEAEPLSDDAPFYSFAAGSDAAIPFYHTLFEHDFDTIDWDLDVVTKKGDDNGETVEYATGTRIKQPGIAVTSGVSTTNPIGYLEDLGFDIIQTGGTIAVGTGGGAISGTEVLSTGELISLTGMTLLLGFFGFSFGMQVGSGFDLDDLEPTDPCPQINFIQIPGGPTLNTEALNEEQMGSLLQMLAATNAFPNAPAPSVGLENTLSDGSTETVPITIADIFSGLPEGLTIEIGDLNPFAIPGEPRILGATFPHPALNKIVIDISVLDTGTFESVLLHEMVHMWIATNEDGLGLDINDATGGDDNPWFRPAIDAAYAELRRFMNALPEPYDGCD